MITHNPLSSVWIRKGSKGSHSEDAQMLTHQHHKSSGPAKSGRAHLLSSPHICTIWITWVMWHGEYVALMGMSHMFASKKARCLSSEEVNVMEPWEKLLPAFPPGWSIGLWRTTLTCGNVWFDSVWLVYISVIMLPYVIHSLFADAVNYAGFQTDSNCHLLFFLPFSDC